MTTSEEPPISPSSLSAPEWTSWIAAHTASTCAIPPDYGLADVATFLGKQEALQLALDGAEIEATGDYPGAVKLYKAAYRLWPALDSIISGGIPKSVRDEAVAGEYPGALFDVVDVRKARASSVMSSKTVLSASDIKALFDAQTSLLSTTTRLENNPQNNTHRKKCATFMNNPRTTRCRRTLLRWWARC